MHKKILFHKYQATGNDFIIIDNRKENIILDNVHIKNMCNRKFGIGADGLILIQNSNIFDFNMKYFNCDGQESTMCGNGGRAASLFYSHIYNLKKTKFSFDSSDGQHIAIVKNENNVSITMNVSSTYNMYKDMIYIDTGSPHLVKFVHELNDLDVSKDGKIIRDNFNKQFGVNVNFVNIIDSSTIHMRTYERGVENETLSCGTGAVAAAISCNILNKTNSNSTNIITRGGKLVINFDNFEGIYKNVILCGSVKKIFKGEIFI